MREIQPASLSWGDPRLEAFLAALVRGDLAPSTIRAYRYDLVEFWGWFMVNRGPEARLEKLGSLDLFRYREHQREAKKARPATVNRRMESLRKLCRWAHREGILKADITSELQPVRRALRLRPAGLHEGEIQALLRSAGVSTQGLSARNYALVQWFLQTGLRVAETAALLQEDLLMRARVGTVRVRRGKGGKEREVPVNTTARRALRLYWDTREELSSEDPVFASSRGTPVSVRSIQHTISELARRAAITRLAVSGYASRCSVLADVTSGLVNLLD